MLLVDTGVFVAAADLDDRDHQACAALIESHHGPLVTTPLVITETGWLGGTSSSKNSVTSSRVSRGHDESVKTIATRRTAPTTSCVPASAWPTHRAQESGCGHNSCECVEALKSSITWTSAPVLTANHPGHSPWSRPQTRAQDRKSIPRSAAQTSKMTATNP